MKLLDYIKGNRRGIDAHRLEKEAMDDPFLAEALEGLDAVPGDHAAAIERLRGRIAGRRSRLWGRKRLLWTTGAAALLLLCLTVGSRFLTRTIEPESFSLLLADVAEESDALFDLDRTDGDSTAQEQAGNFTRRRSAIVAQELPAPVRQEIEQELAVVAVADMDSNVEHFIDARMSEELQEERVDSPAVAFQLSGMVSKSAHKEEAKIANRVTGRVTDAQGVPLPGATIQVRGTRIGATADIDGRFTLNDAQPGALLEASFLGFELSTVVLPEDSQPVLIALNESTMQLEDMVVVGYGTWRSDAGGFSSSVEPRIVPNAEPAAGPEAFNDYLKARITPQYNESGEKITGRVVLEFRVNRQGRPVGIRVAEGLSPDADEAAKRLLENAPDWKRSNGRVKVSIPFQ